MPGYLTERDYKDRGLSPEKQGVSVYNDSGVILTPGKLVYVSGWSLAPSGGGWVRNVKQAGASTTSPAHRAEYVVLETIAVGSFGRVGKSGVVRDLNTNGVTTAGDPVYLDTTLGAFSATAPTAAAANVQIVGFATVKSATVGVVRFDLSREPVSLGSQGVLNASLLGIKTSVVNIPAAAGALASADVGIPVTLVLDIPDAASGNVDFTGFPYKARVIDAVYVKTGGAGNAGNNSKVVNQTAGSDITDAVNSATDTARVPAGQLNDAGWTLAAGATVRVSTTKAGGNNAHTWVLTLVRVA